MITQQLRASSTDESNSGTLPKAGGKGRENMEPDAGVSGNGNTGQRDRPAKRARARERESERAQDGPRGRPFLDLVVGNPKHDGIAVVRVPAFEIAAGGDVIRCSWE